MKTPRELILERHRSTESKLDTIRGEELAAYVRAGVVSPSARHAPGLNLSRMIRKFWQESIWPWRRFWIGITAVWFVLLALNLASYERPSMAHRSATRRDPQLLAAWREQRLLMLQRLEPYAAPSAAPPKIPGPRSEQRPVLRIG